MPVRTIALAAISATVLSAQVIGPSINMVTGVTWPGGDPFLQRQNEPSIAVSSRNALHLLAGANDYRTVDLPGVADSQPDRPTGDAWLGVFKSIDGGLTWKSTLVPGYPQDRSAAGAQSPLQRGKLEAGADPVVRPGTNGLFYFGGVAFQRKDAGISKIFVARYIDDNLASSADSIRYVSTATVRDGDAKRFVDKPTFAVDVFRDRPGVPAGQQPVCRIAGDQATAILGQAFPAGRVYAAWTEFIGDDPNPDNRPDASIYFAYSDDCGATWSAGRKVSGFDAINHGAAIAVDQLNGAVHVVWRVINVNKKNSASLMHAVSVDLGSSFSTPEKIADFTPFDQSTTSIPQGFRTRGFPTIAVDGEGLMGTGPGTLYVAWSALTDSKSPDARIMIARAAPTDPNRPWECVFEGCKLWSAPLALEANASPGHQFMPAMNFSNGKLSVAWYDLRETNVAYQYDKAKKATGVEGPPEYAERPTPRNPDLPFGVPIQDRQGVRRYLLDVRLAQTKVGSNVFAPSKRVSSYAFGLRSKASSVIEQLEVNPPNFPMFRLGQVPFIGDYIDLGGATFTVGADGKWRFNTRPGDPETLHVAWTDNRNVVPPRDYDWKNYTPIALAGPASGVSLVDPTQSPNFCKVAGNTGIRNQDIFTARISPGVIASAKSNAKPLNQRVQRAFPVTVFNTSPEVGNYLLRIKPPLPEGGTATFLQFDANNTGSSAITEIALRVPPHSSMTRSIFLTSTQPYATVQVEVIEARFGQVAQPVTVDINRDGTFPSFPEQAEAVRELFNPDISNPDISNPDISNPDISNPDISNPDISNPDISNPDISNRTFRNPDISNPDISNPDISNRGLRNIRIANPDISNPDISNPDISNPDISNPDISNPDISNPDISNSALNDTTWAVTNRGNTPASYLLKFIENQVRPEKVWLQLVVSKRYDTPAADACTLKLQPHYSVILNGPVVTLTAPSQPPQPKIAGRAASVPADLYNVKVPDTLGIPSVPVAPGERILVTVRSLDRTTSDPKAARLRYDPAKALTLVPVSDARNSDTDQVALPLTIATSSLAAAKVGDPYSQSLAAVGGSGNYHWAVSPVTPLPAGLTLDAATGTIAGTPTANAVVNVWFFATDNPGSKDDANTVNSKDRWTSKRLTLIVDPVGSVGGIAISSPATLPPAAVGTTYSYALSATGGSAPLAWNLVSPATSLPPGLQLDSSGVIKGTPSTAGSYSFTVRVADTAGSAATITLAVVVNPKGDPPPVPAIAGIANCASYQAGSIAPGEIVCIFGSNLGPAAGVSGTVTQQGFVSTTTGGVQVLFNGVLAPVIYASAGQVNAVVPFEVSGQSSATVVVSVNGQSTSASVSVASVAPGIFTTSQSGAGQGAVINQDGTFNRAGAAAPVGSVVAIYATGAGLTNPATATGFVTGALNKVALPVSVTIGGQAAEVTYSGAAPGIVAGGVQINAKIPNVPAGNQPLVIVVGGVGSAPGVTIAVR